MRSIVLALLLVSLGGCDSGRTSTNTVNPPAPPDPESNTFRVAVVSSSTYPDGTFVFLIDGEENPELTLTRGETYLFDMAGTPAHHPFHISTNPAGGDGGANAWMDGVAGNFATGDDTLTFVVPENAPDLLFYQCRNHDLMGARLNIVSS